MTNSINKTKKDYCDICCDNSFLIECIICNKKACKKCIEKYILDLNKKAQCMFCNVVYNKYSLVKMMGITFVKNKYNKHLKKNILENQKNLLYLYQDRAEKEIILENTQKELYELSSKILKLKQYINCIEVDKNKPNYLNKRCSYDKCKGYLNILNKCISCNKICENDDKDYKIFKCPQCNNNIYKEDSNQLYCSKCYIVFDCVYNTIIKITNKNPYYEVFNFKKNIKTVNNFENILYDKVFYFVDNNKNINKNIRDIVYSIKELSLLYYNINNNNNVIKKELLSIEKHIENIDIRYIKNEILEQDYNKIILNKLYKLIILKQKNNIADFLLVYIKQYLSIFYDTIILNIKKENEIDNYDINFFNDNIKKINNLKDFFIKEEIKLDNTFGKINYFTILKYDINSLKEKEEDIKCMFVDCCNKNSFYKCILCNKSICENCLVNDRAPSCLTCDIILLPKNKPCKKYNDNLIDYHKSKLLTYQFKIEKENKILNIKKELSVLQKNFNKNKILYHKIKNNKKISNNFIRPCSLYECKGFLNTLWKCSICNNTTCKDCFETINGENHICNEDIKKSSQLLKSETKICPVCHISIYKIDGCDQMYCTKCNTAFSWKTGEIEKGRIHNPHYYEYLRNISIDGNIRREEENNDNFCLELNNMTSEKLTRITVFLKRLSIKNKDVSILHNIFNTILKFLIYYFETDEVFNNTNQKNIKYDNNIIKTSIEYIRNKINNDKFEKIIYSIYNKKEILEEKRNIIITLREIIRDLLRMFIYKYENNISTLIDNYKDDIYDLKLNKYEENIYFHCNDKNVYEKWEIINKNFMLVLNDISLNIIIDFKKLNDSFMNIYDYSKNQEYFVNKIYNTKQVLINNLIIN